MPPPDHFEPIPGLGPATTIANVNGPNKPPLPTGLSRVSQQVHGIEVHLPPLIAGAVVAAFATTVADGLGNELLTHYYLEEQRVKVNLDRVLDRLMLEFTRHLWDELFDFYSRSAADGGTAVRQVELLFEGPVRQLVLMLNGPETARCILDRLGPGLSQRPQTWSTTARGIDLQLSLQLLCGFWHREYPTHSPGGCPQEIARTIHTRLLQGDASKALVADIRRYLMSPQFVQAHLIESATWDIIMKRRRPPPTDGFHAVQFRFECQLFGPQEGIGDPQLVNIASLPAITGHPNSYVQTTVAEYVEQQFPRCGRLVLNCLSDAISSAACSSRDGGPFSGMSMWDGSEGKGAFCPGLRMLVMEVEAGSLRLSVSAWTHALVEIFQHMAWTCAALSASPFPGMLSECAVEVSGWEYTEESVYINCSLAHKPVPEGDGSPSLTQLRGAAFATGFPIDHPAFQHRHT